MKEVHEICVSVSPKSFDSPAGIEILVNETGVLLTHERVKFP